MTKHVSYCRNCAAQCGIELTVEEGKITTIRGDKDNPLSKGYFCIKGMTSIDLHNGEDRLDHCLKKVGKDSFEPIDKYAAIDEVAEKLGKIVAEHGPDSVAIYAGTGMNRTSLVNSAIKAWLDAMDSPYLYTSMSLDQPAKWIVALRMGSFITGKYSTLDADVIMLSGSNPAVSHSSLSGPMANPMHYVKEGRKRGMKLVVIDPATTQTAKLADIHVRIKPGEDAAFYAGLLHIIFKNSWQNDDFCDRFVTSVDSLKDAVRDFTPEFVAARTDVPVETILEVAEFFAKAEKKSSHTGTGPDMSLHSNLSEHLSEALNAVCGGFRREGDVMRNLGVLFNTGLAKETVVPPNRSWEHGPKMHTANVGQFFGEYPTALLPQEIMNKGEKRIRALIVIGGNLAKALSDPNYVLPAFDELDLLVNLDQRRTETGDLSDYQFGVNLPYERLDLNAILEVARHISFGQVAKPALTPPEGVIEDWEFFTELAARMGKTLKFKRTAFAGAYKDIPGPTYDVAPGDKVTAEDLIRFMVAQGRLDYDDLIANPHGIAPEDGQEVIKAADETMTARLDVCPPDVFEEIRTVYEEQDDDAADFPFRMIARRLLEVVNSAYTESSKARRRYPTNPIFMSPEDMESLGLEANDGVAVVSRHGRITGTVRKEKGMKPGVIAISHAWGKANSDDDADKDAFSGRLVSVRKDLSPINFMPRQSGVPVSIKPL